MTLRPETAIGRVEVLKTGVIALPARSSAGYGDPVRVDVPARGPSFCAPRPADAGGLDGTRPDGSRARDPASGGTHLRGGRPRGGPPQRGMALGGLNFLGSQSGSVCLPNPSLYTQGYNLVLGIWEISGPVVSAPPDTMRACRSATVGEAREC